MNVTGNKTLWTCVATFVTTVGVAIKDVVAGSMPSQETILVGLGAIVGIFAALKGKRIEAKLDALNKNSEVKP